MNTESKEQIKKEYLEELTKLYKKYKENHPGLAGGLDGGFPIQEEKRITKKYFERLKSLDN